MSKPAMANGVAEEEFESVEKILQVGRCGRAVAGGAGDAEHRRGPRGEPSFVSGRPAPCQPPDSHAAAARRCSGPPPPVAPHRPTHLRRHRRHRCLPPVPPPGLSAATRPLRAQEHLPPEKLAQVQGVLYGLNMGKPVEALPLDPDAVAAADAGGYDLQAYRFHAAPEQLRPPRVVRVGLVQNSIKAPTSAPYVEQRQVRGGGAGWGWCWEGGGGSPVAPALPHSPRSPCPTPPPPHTAGHL